MAYYDAWLLSQDQDFMNRAGMCAEEEGLGFEWGINNRHSIAAAPGFAADYASALAGGVPSPGRDQAVISDGELLSAVQALKAEQAPATG